MTAILFHLGLAGYAIGAMGHLIHLAGPRLHGPPAPGPGESEAHGGRALRWGEGAMLAGFLLHGAAVVLRLPTLFQRGPFPFAEGISLAAFLTVGIYLVVARLYRIPSIGAFLAPLVVAALLPLHAFPSPEAGFPPWAGAIRPLHIGAAILGLALFALGFVVSVMYLLLDRQLKAKKLGAAFRFPPLALLDRLTHGLVIVGFGLLSFTIVTGSVFSMAEHHTLFALRSKETLAVGAWILSALVLLLRQLVGWRGRRVALATMAGFVLMSIAYVGSFIGRPI